MTKKNQLLHLLSSISTIFLLTSCATIVSKSTYPISLHSNPPVVEVTIMDQGKQVVYEGKTPAIVELKSGAGYFKAATYTVTFKKEGFDARTFPINSDIDMWFFGNFFLGGIIGMVIVDPITGAMYKLQPQYIHAELYESQHGSTGLSHPAQIYSQYDQSFHLKCYLVRINP